jgi:hypothetical protein
MGSASTFHNFKLGDIVYHRQVYSHREALKIVGIREHELELEGDYSGMHNIIQKQWMPIKGVSRIHNHAYKAKCRQTAVDIEALAIPVDPNHDNMTRTMFDLLGMVLILTNDVSLNPEY